LQEGDYEIRTDGGNAIYVGTIQDGKPKMLFRSADPPHEQTVSGIIEGSKDRVPRIKNFLSDPVNFRIWAAQEAAYDSEGIFDSNIGTLESWSELRDWGLTPFDGIGKNPITGGPILNEKSPGNVLIQRSPTGGWNIAGIGKDGKGIPVK
jgi:hypothetical protein